jgi:hypothetical protein
MSTPVLGGFCSHDEGCSTDYYARGLCKRHYRQFWNSPEFVPTCQPRDVPPVCVCDEPQDVSAIGECQACFRPFTEFFAECRAAWRVHLGMDFAARSSVTTAAVTGGVPGTGSRLPCPAVRT